VIVNADDFGYRAEVNRAIVEAFEAGLATSTSLMPNQEGFEEACELARDRSLVGRVGAHLVLTRGEPLTEPMRRLRRFCDVDGRFFEWRGSGSAFRLAGAERDAVGRELRAQVERCGGLGVQLTHVDSHHHVHNEWAIGGIVVRLAREFRIPRVRLARNCGTGIGPASALYKRLFNRRLRRTGLGGTRYFGDIEDWLHLRDSGADASDLDDFEVMTHPRVGEDGCLVDLELASQALEELLRPLLRIA
jgi:predicted glycoside hydrolase/deacetylase ChbG (UPF0249 family)